MTADPLAQFRRVPQHPTRDGGMIQGQSALQRPGRASFMKMVDEPQATPGTNHREGTLATRSPTAATACANRGHQYKKATQCSKSQWLNAVEIKKTGGV